MPSVSAASPTVLITGCSSGIGHCLALGLRARGYRVFATARKPADVAALRVQGFEALELDLDRSESIAAAVAAVAVATGGDLFALINNGAYGQPGAVEDLSRATLRAQFETNVFGTHELTNLVIPLMRRRGGGRIIQISSILGRACLAYRGAYNASKYALEALSDTLRLELADSGIAVSLIEPGPITSRFRTNAGAHFMAAIDRERSPHRVYYEAVAKRLGGTKPLPFTLPPEAVLAKVIRALAARAPKPRYFVTFPTYLFTALKWLLTDPAMDRFLGKITRGQR